MLAALAVLAVAGGAGASVPPPEPPEVLEGWPEVLPERVDRVDVEPAPPATSPAAVTAGDRFRLLDPATLDWLVWTGRPHRPYFFVELETRVRGISFLAWEQRQAFEGFSLDLAVGEWETGLIYARNRYLDPELGRWLTPDPMGYVDSPSLYTAFGNDPINQSDPLGLAVITRDDVQTQRETVTAWQRWEDQETLKGGLVLIEQVGGDVSHGDLQLALLEHFKSRPRISESEAIGLVVALTGPGEGVNDVLGELEGIGRWAELLDAYLINYPLAVTGGELAFGARALVANAQQVGWQTALRQVAQRSTATPSLAESAPAPRVWGPHNGPGPLGRKAAETFRSGTYREVVLAEELTLYRVYGGTAGELSPYWSRVRPAGPLQSQLDSALLPEWGNTATRVTSIRVPAGTTVYEGAAAPQVGQAGLPSLLGGGNQVYVPRVNPAWVLGP